MSPTIQDLSRFRLPKGFRGRSAFAVQLWWIVQASLFRLSPQFMYGWRRFLLRLFGAHIGEKAIVRPTVRVTYPWKLSIGAYSWIGDRVELYTLAPIDIGDHAVVSQESYLCTGNHDYRRAEFPMACKPIVVKSQVWIAARVFVCPGVTIGEGAVVQACSQVFGDVAPGVVAAGCPASARGMRLSTSPETK